MDVQETSSETEIPPQGETPEAKQPDDLTGLRSALEKERENRKVFEKEAKRVKSLEAQLAEFQKAQMTETEKLVEQARTETENSVRAEIRRDRVLDKIEVLSAGKFADAEDARLRLSSRVDEFVTDDGLIDAKAIEDALIKLLTEKPHLAASGKRFEGTGDGGVRGGKPGPTLDQQIDEAEKASNFRLAIALKRQRASLNKPPS